ncbi:hypothetical protein BJY04DRAFT_203756 [Aspergillus karnatakaensis]|uniref:Ran GTPase-binding protein MOG1 n=1 Tax=Aspergillus karnatakaensis TaxID=1810916 RepID=UPI003CCE0B70
MATLSPQGLYGSAIKAVIPQGWLDASELRQIPDHQELFLSPTTLSNLIYEINERVSPETALSALQSTPTTNRDTLEILGPNPDSTTETIDKAAVLYHLNDIRDGNDDILRIVAPPQQVTLQKLPSARAYKGIAQITSPSPTARSGGAPTSVGGAAAGSSADGALTSSVSVHYFLVRLEEQETDFLVFFNVPQKEFDERGDPSGLAAEEELAAAVVDGLVGGLEIVDWGLFGA